MRSSRAGSQSLVEFALVAPLVIMLAMSAWDGGSVLREQVVLQQAARDGARAGATAYGGATNTIIGDAVLASAADLPGLGSAGNFLTVTSDNQSITVQVQYPHTLVTPILRQLWSGGRGSVTLSAAATFYVPSQPAPPTIVVSTPLPTPTFTVTPTPTPTSTPTVVATSTPTPSPTQSLPNPCGTASVNLPALANNTGYWCSVRLTSASLILASWQDNFDSNNQIQIYLNNPSPFGGQPDPSTLDPNRTPLSNVNDIGFDFRSNAGVLWSTSFVCVQPGTYSVYFFNRGTPISASSGSVTAFDCGGP